MSIWSQLGVSRSTFPWPFFSLGALLFCAVAWTHPKGLLCVHLATRGTLHKHLRQARPMAQFAVFLRKLHAQLYHSL